MKKCVDCGLNKPSNTDEFPKWKTYADGLRPYCRACERIRKNNYRAAHKEEHREYSRNYRLNNIEKNRDHQKKYYNSNKEQISQYHKEYNKKNKNRIKISKKDYNNFYSKIRRTNDPLFKLRKDFGNHINIILRKNGIVREKSKLNYLPYTIEQLKTYLESLFEPWMTWNNWGKYNSKSWNDNDPTTWTWQIDHIIPQSNFKYSSMEDEEFKQCWALDNLRPLNAKQNVIDGVNRYRHEGYK